MKAPLVSIGVPVYNGEKYIRQALDGLIAQTYQNFEIIISDNASTDNTKNICLEYINRDNRISYYGNEINIGATENFNRLVKLAKGKYFMWAAADDIFLPKFIEKCVEKMEEEPSLILCYSSLRFIDEKGQVIKNVNYDLYDNPNLSDHDMEARLKKWWGRNGWYAVYGLYRLDILCSSNLFMNVYGGDVLFITELLYKGPFGKIPQVLFLYRQFQKKTEIDRYNSQSEENKSKSLSLDYCHVNLYINIYDNILAHDFTLSKKIILILNLVRAWKRHVYNKLNGFVIFSIKTREFPNILKVSWFYILEIIKTPYNLTLKVINKITYFLRCCLN